MHRWLHRAVTNTALEVELTSYRKNISPFEFIETTSPSQKEEILSIIQ